MDITAKTPGISFLVFVLFFFASCSGSKDDPKPEQGSITFIFTHYHEDERLKFDTLIYTNAAGNQYMVNEIQYFISDVKLHHQDGSYQMIDEWKDIHYVDTDLPDTHTWEVYDPITPGNYEKITFTFGISEDKNQSLMFVNPPERDMFWPEILGGGYHYLKLNGKWLAASEQILPFDFHLGIGQTYAGGVVHTDSITGFIQNHFEVELPASSFTMEHGSHLLFEIKMNVENWFRNPHVYDHDAWGGDIMQNQDAMKTGCENGAEDVFTVLEQIPLFPTAKK